jgi:hypothetical protein
MDFNLGWVISMVVLIIGASIATEIDMRVTDKKRGMK